MTGQSAAVQVFISSTSLDLQAERKAVEAVVQQTRSAKYVGMEYFGSRSETTRQASLDEVDRSHVYIGIFGGRYGSGITEAEYRRARERNLPCFIYVKAAGSVPPEWEESDPDGARQLHALKEELSKNHTVKEFASA